MTAVTIERLNARLNSPVAIDAARREAWLAAFAAQSGEALGAGSVGDDEWLLIRHLQLNASWRADAADVDVGHECGRALRQAVELALASGADTGNCVRYVSRQHALADLLYRSAFGEGARQWAWQRMGWLVRADGDTQRALATGVTLLLREPAWIWPVLQRIVDAEEATASLTALLRALPAADWMLLFAACPQTAAYAGLLTSQRSGIEPGGEVDLLSSPRVQRLLAWAAARPHLARRHLDTLAVLLAAQALPVSASRALAARRFATAHAALIHRLEPADAQRREIDPHAQDATRAAEWPLAKSETRGAPVLEARELPELPDALVWQPTAWAGALFWLARVAASEAFQRIERDDATGDDALPLHDALPLLLRAIVEALGVPPDDPAHAAFCGGRAPGGALPEACVAQAAALLAEWTQWLDAHAPELPVPRLRAVCERAGRLRVESGWLAVHLPLASVDPCVRRLGLDLDPGWLPWLGCVVRFHYDD